jgi:RNA polymerase sigma-70 factor (ECF subfamily)
MHTKETSLASSAPPLDDIFRDHAPRIYTLARRMLGNDADAEDVTQDVLLQLIRKLDTFRGESAFPTWLHRITVNAALAHRRKRAQRDGRRSHESVEDVLETMPPSRTVRRWSVPPEDAVLDQEMRSLIEKAIAGLPEMYRDVYVLADIEQLSNQEIADLLSLSVAAVKSRLHRARLLMRHALAPHFEEGPE